MILYWLAWLLVRARGLTNLILGRGMHRSGFTVPCRGCTVTSPHDSHLARGALTVLGGRR